MFKNRLRRALYLRLPYLGAIVLWCIPVPVTIYVLPGTIVLPDTSWPSVMVLGLATLTTLGIPVFLFGLIVPQFDILYLTRKENLLRVGLTMLAQLVVYGLFFAQATILSAIYFPISRQPGPINIQLVTMIIIVGLVSYLLWVLLGRIPDPVSGRMSRAIHALLATLFATALSFFAVIASGIP